MKPESLSQVTQGLLVGLDLLFTGLVVLAVATATHPGASSWAVALHGAAFIGCYAIGRVMLRTEHVPLDTSRFRWWPEGVWNTALVVSWLGLLFLSQPALWLAFPLMLFQLHSLGPRAGMVALICTTGIAIGSAWRGGLMGWPSLGTVLGPMVGASVAAAVVLGLEALAREAQQRQRLIDELSETREYLAEAERNNAVLGERERLAREIHDTLAQGFSAIDLLLRAAAPQVKAPAVQELLGQAAQTARDSLDEARRFVGALAPAALDHNTLTTALRHACEGSMELDPGLNVALEVTGDPQSLGVSADAALLRVTQSALANVVQHAEATSATVRLTYESEQVILSVIDDGRGFTPDSRPRGGGFGLRGMASRAAELRGEFTVISAEDRGTTVRMGLPTLKE